jgi:hypothetical protein
LEVIGVSKYVYFVGLREMCFYEVFFSFKEICAEYQTESKSILGKISRGEKKICPKTLRNKKQECQPLDCNIRFSETWRLLRN